MAFGTGGSDNIEIKIRVDAQGGIKVLDELGKEIKEVSGAADTGGKAVDKYRMRWTELNQALEVGLKAFRLAQRGYRELGQAMERAREVEGLTRGFQNLQTSIGQVADKSIAGLRAATLGLVSDMQLMQQANQAVLLGVDDGSGKFDELTASALKLGDAMGISAANAIDSLVIGIGRQSRMMLDNLGVVVRTEEVYEQYAASIGKTVEALTQEEQRLAFNKAAFEAITEKAAKLTDVQNTGAVAWARLQATMKNTYDEVVKQISANPELAKALDDVNAAIKEINWAQFAQDMAEVIAVVAQLTSWLAKNLVDALNDVNNGIKVASLAWEIYINNFGRIGIINSTKLAIQSLNKEIANRQVARQQVEFWTEMGKALGLTGDNAAAAAPKINTVTNAVTNLSTALAKTDPLLEEMNAQFEAGQLDKIKDTFADLFGGGEEGKPGEKGAGNIFGDLFADTFGIESDLAGQFGNIFSGAMTEALTSGDVAGAISGGLTSAVEVGVESIAPGLGAIAAAGLQPLIDGLVGGISEMFGGGETNLGQEFRDAFESWFNDAIAGADVEVVIDGQMQKIRDLVTDVAAAYEHVHAEGFYGIGVALSTMFDNAEVSAQQISSILGYNLADSVSNLSVVVGQLGLSFEQLGEMAQQAFDAGTISAHDFMVALVDLANLSAVGTGEVDAAIQAKIDAANAAASVTIPTPSYSGGGGGGYSAADEAERALEQRRRSIGSSAMSLFERAVGAGYGPTRALYEEARKAAARLYDLQERYDKKLEEGERITKKFLNNFINAKDAVDEFGKALEEALTPAEKIDSAIEKFLAGALSTADALKQVNEAQTAIGEGMAGFGNVTGAYEMLLKGGVNTALGVKNLAVEAKEAGYSLGTVYEMLLQAGANKQTLQQIFSQLGKYDINTIDALLQIDDSELLELTNALETTVIEIPVRYVVVSDETKNTVGVGSNKRPKNKHKKIKSKKNKTNAAGLTA